MEGNSTNTWIPSFLFLVAESPWTSIKQNRTLTTHTNQHCRVRLYTFAGQPLSKQLYINSQAIRDDQLVHKNQSFTFVVCSKGSYVYFIFYFTPGNLTNRPQRICIENMLIPGVDLEGWALLQLMLWPQHTVRSRQRISNTSAEVDFTSRPHEFQGRIC